MPSKPETVHEGMFDACMSQIKELLAYEMAKIQNQKSTVDLSRSSNQFSLLPKT